MRKFISPVLRKLIKVATLLLVFVVLLHSSKNDKNLSAESIAPFGVSDTDSVSGFFDSQVDETVALESQTSCSIELPAISIGKLHLRF
jgi:Uri superfamily endonuclease